MAYATLTDLIERAGEIEIQQIADRDGDMIPDADVIDAALEDAGNLIDGHIRTRYATPLPSVPPIIRIWAVSIARYALHRNGAPEHVRDDYRDAIAALKDVAAGKIGLPVPDGEVAPAEKLGRVMSSHPPAVFTPTRMRGWS